MGDVIDKITSGDKIVREIKLSFVITADENEYLPDEVEGAISTLKGSLDDVGGKVKVVVYREERLIRTKGKKEKKNGN